MPARWRGHIHLALNATWFLGQILAILSAALIFGIMHAYNAWKLLFVVAVLPAFPLLYYRRKVPESPRWQY
jgi:MFS family permease